MKKRIKIILINNCGSPPESPFNEFRARWIKQRLANPRIPDSEEFYFLQQWNLLPVELQRQASAPIGTIHA